MGDNFPAGFSARESNLKFSFFYNCFSALGGRRAGVCISADSAAGEADALIIEAEHAPAGAIIFLQAFLRVRVIYAPVVVYQLSELCIGP